MGQLFIVTFLDWRGNLIWSNLIKFDQVWSILDGSDPKKSKIKQPFLSFLWMWQLFIVTFFDWWEIQFNQVISSLIKFDPIWTDLIQKTKKLNRNFILFWRYWGTSLIISNTFSNDLSSRSGVRTIRLGNWYVSNPDKVLDKLLNRQKKISVNFVVRVCFMVVFDKNE